MATLQNPATFYGAIRQDRGETFLATLSLMSTGSILVAVFSLDKLDFLLSEHCSIMEVDWQGDIEVRANSLKSNCVCPNLLQNHMKVWYLSIMYYKTFLSEHMKGVKRMEFSTDPSVPTSLSRLTTLAEVQCAALFQQKDDSEEKH